MVLQDDIFTFVSIKIITIIIFFPSMKLHFIFKPADIARRLTAIKLQKQSKTGFVPTVIHLSTELSTMSYFTRKKGRLKKRPFYGMYAYVRFFVTSTAAAIAATAMTIRAVSPLSPVAGTEEAGEELPPGAAEDVWAVVSEEVSTGVSEDSSAGAAVCTPISVNPIHSRDV